MVVQEVAKLFLSSRRRGSGGDKSCSPATMHIYEWNMKVFVDFLSSQRISGYKDVGRHQVEAFLDHLETKQNRGEWKEATKLQILRTLRTFFRWIDDDEDFMKDDFKGWSRLKKAFPRRIKKNPRRTDIPPNAILKKFKASFNGSDVWEYRNYIVASLLTDTGLRISEVCNLRIDHMNLDQQVLVVTGKTGVRTVGVTKEMVRLLKAWLSKREDLPKAQDSPYVFVSKRAPKMTNNGFGQGFRKHCKAQNLPRVTAHTFRHAFSTNFLSQGGDIEKLRMMTGHSSYEMLKDYLHLAQIGSKEMQAELERVSFLKELE